MMTNTEIQHAVSAYNFNQAIIDSLPECCADCDLETKAEAIQLRNKAIDAIRENGCLGVAAGLGL